MNRNHTQPANAFRKSKGFTLIELMVTVAIIAILSTIAYASYSSFITKSRRAAATTCLQERAQFLERFYTTNLSYLDPVTGAAPAIAQCGPEIANFYQVGYAVASTARTYQLQAVPQANQADAKCETLTLDSGGQRGSGGTGTVDDCW
jgi:type IV pilus assembly protein PilE